MRKVVNTIFAVFLLVTIVSSCSKENPNATAVPFCEIPVMGSIKIDFTNMVGADTLELLTQNYLNANGDTFNVSTLNYYISNIQLTSTDDVVYSDYESYHLIKASDPSSLNFTLNGFLPISYKAITFTIGVDSLRNVSGAQTGALDPVHNMFWSWSSGYIFTKLEGTSPQSPTGNIAFHIAGFSGGYNALRTVTLNFPTNANVTQTTTPTVRIKTDIAEWFMNPSITKFGIRYSVTMSGPQASAMATNYMDMFSVVQVDN